MFRLFLSVMCLFFCFSIDAVAKPTIAILKFDVMKTAVVFAPGFVSVEVVEAQTKMLTTDLITTLQKTRKFDLVERDRMLDIMEEHKLAEGGKVDPAKALALGKLLNADYLIMGKIERFSASAKMRKMAYVKTVETVYQGDLIISMRIVDSKTGRIVSAEKIKGALEQKAGKSAIDFLESLKEKTVEDMVNAVIDGVFPLKIVKTKGEEVYLNRGEGAGFKVGDLFHAYNQGEALVDPDTGENLGSEETLVATIEVTAVLKKFSKGKVVSSKGKIAAEAILRRAKKEVVAQPGKPLTPGSSGKPVKW